MTIATPRFLEALDYAVRLHGADVKKSTSIPYVAHLLGVCSLVLVDGGSEDEAIGALLHDALEDHPQEATRDVIDHRFGHVVLAIVEGCTDTPPDYAGGPKPPWKERKTKYLEHLRSAAPNVVRVSLADKVDNIRAVLAEYRRIGEDLWKRFKAGKEGQLWYYRSLVGAFREAGATGSLIEEYDRTVSGLERLAGASHGHEPAIGP